MLLIITALPVVGNMDAQHYDKEGEMSVDLTVSPIYDKETYMVPMRDGIKLATDVYLPDEGIDPHGSVLIRTVYNKNNINKFLNGQDYYLEEWVDEYKWPFVVQDERGYYASEGEPTWPGGAYFDGYDTVEWVASQDWSNGKIATWGRSAFGMNQYFMAGSNPPHLSCQYVGVATSDIHTGECFQGGEAIIYLLEYYLNEEELLEIFEHENFTHEYWGNVSLEDNWQNVNVPAIHIGGWYDPYLQGTIDAFMGYHYQGGDGAKGKSKLVMGPWTHLQFGYNESDTGDLTFPDNQYDTISRNMFKDMINQYTMNNGNDFDKWPTASYYVMGDVDDPDAPGNEWRYADDWPISTVETPYYLHEGELLSPDNPGSYSPITYSYDPTNPVPTKGGQNLAILFDGPMDQRSVEGRDDVLVFSSPVLTEPVETTGPIKARLFVSSDCVDTDFTVKITDVYPDDRSMIIADGILRMRNRNGRDHWEFMNPGDIYEVEVDLWSTSYIWNTGHRIRVAVSSSNYPRFLANPNTADGIGQNTTYDIAQNTLYLDSDHPSCILLQNPNNYAPDEPSITGETNGKKKTKYEYTFNSVDPESDDVKYLIDWGDDKTEWTDFHASGMDVKIKHTWSKKGNYTIKARAKDVNGLWSDWEKLQVSMPKNKVHIFNFPLLDWLFNRFPNAFPVLRYLVGL